MAVWRLSLLLACFMWHPSRSIPQHHAVAKNNHDPFCAVWGQGHHRTFDGKVYSFKGQCTYGLLGDCQTNSFFIHVKTTNCDGVTCTRDVLIYVGGHVELALLRINGDAKVFFKDGELTLPTKRGSFVVERTGSYIYVTSGLGFKLTWDGRGYVAVDAGANLKNGTCGLCGNNNGVDGDDFLSLDKIDLETPTRFALSWQMTKLGEKCAETSRMSTCDGRNKQDHCTLMNSTLFSECHLLVDPKPYLDICHNEASCHGNNSNSHCPIMEAYARACLKVGVAIEWKSADLCPETCSGGRVYMSCGSACEKTCSSTHLPCKHHACSDGCHCPEDTVLHQGRCIQTKLCPCLHNGKEYQAGESIHSECNICRCQAGKWVCTNNDCGAVCHAIGDPHYQTFDGKQYQFHGACSYYMMYDKNYEIIAENTACGPTEAPSTCTKSVTIITAGIRVELLGMGRVNIDGLNVRSLPYVRSAVGIYQASSEFVRVTLQNGIIILWDDKKRLYIYVPPHFRKKTLGLCGLYDHNQANDFTTLDGDVETDVTSFGNKWSARQCHQVASFSTMSVNPCEMNIERKSEAAEYCAVLRSAIFKGCHTTVDVEAYVKNCIHDLCGCKGEVSGCLCPMVASYADACSRKGIVINWRPDVPQCAVTCPEGQVYHTCGDGCKYTCRNIAAERTCVNMCVEGCSCPDGKALDKNNRCIPINQCPCQHGGKEFPSGSSRGHGDETCECAYGTWNCSKSISKRDLQCDASANMVYTACVPPCRKTCSTLHSHLQCSQEACEPGCSCREGFVWNEAEHTCVLPQHCTCSHGGATYTEGQTIKSACNLCTCKGSQWNCTKNECRGVCRLWGDSHYTTFDGRDYEFQGDCEHVLMQNIRSDEQHYVITAESVPCGSTGVTCAKTIRFDIGKRGSKDCKTLILESGKDVILDEDSPFVVQEIGMFLSVTTPIGISLLWDKGTRVYVTIDTYFKNKIHGLCGNFNGNQDDDFIGPNGGPPITKATEFGDMWQVDTCCPPSTEVEDTCAKNQDRKAWAEMSCGALKSERFSACHSVVPVDPYYERCVFDACGCDHGGECACVCTAMAVYAHECAQADVLLKWRHQDLCPIQCEDCEEYNPCITSCSKPTCADLSQNATLPGHCDSDVCVEGCDLKPCPRGEVYFNTTKPLQCVPENVCKPRCTVNGVTYEDGDRVYDGSVCDPCQLCFCNKGSVKITGSTCPPTTVTRPTLPTSTVKQTTVSVTSEAVATEKQTTVSPTSEPITTQAPVTTSIETEAPTTHVRETEAPQVTTESHVTTKKETKPVELTTSGIVTTEKRTTTAVLETETSVMPEEPDTLPAKSTTRKVTESITSSITTEIQEVEEATTIISKTTVIAPEETTSRSTIRTPEVTSSITTPFTTRPPKCTVNGWTQWMNSYLPLPINKGDLETYRNLRRFHQFCGLHEIVAIQCRAVGDDVTAEYDGQNVSCNVKEGLVCHNADQTDGEICYDYEVRFFCECPTVTQTTPSVKPTTEGVQYTTENPATEISTMSEHVTTEALPTIPPTCEKTGWTHWMNSHNPANDNRGDLETYPNLRKRYGFCQLSDILAIECEAVGYWQAAEYSGQKVTCNTKEGLICYHANQSPQGTKCLDYKVRFFCHCGEETTVSQSTSRSSVAPETTPTEGTVYPTATTEAIEEKTTNTQTTARLASTTTKPTTTQKQPTTVPVELTTQSSTTKSTTPEELTTQSSSTTTTTTTTSRPPTTTTTSPPECHETGWTKWISVTDPRKNEDGDLETYDNIRGVYRHFCPSDHVTYIQCRSIATKQGFQYGRDVHVTCDVAHGLRCFNKQQPFGECDDYEIRVFCQCDNDPCRHGLVDNTSDQQLSASSIYFMDPRNGPQRARLHTIRDAGGYGGWTAGDSGAGEWIQVDFLQLVNVSGVLTQGRHDYKAWVTEYRVLYSDQHCNVFHYVEELDRNPAIFGGNVDQNTEVINVFPDHISARCIRINPVRHHLLNSLRFDVLGCLPGETTPATKPTTLPPSSPTTKSTTATTTQPSTTPAVTLPPICVDGWTLWMNTDKPTQNHAFERHGPGDYEIPEHLHRCHSFCAESEVVDIQCRVAGDNITWYLSDDDKATCDVKTGFVCINAEQHMQTCMDYEVRFLCQCSETTKPVSATTTTKRTTEASTTPKVTQGQEEFTTETAKQVTTEKVTTHVVTSQSETTQTTRSTTVTTSPTSHPSVTTESERCVQGWTGWMNTDKPGLNHDYETRGPGDYELVDQVRKSNMFCETPSAIECKESNSSRMWHMSEQDKLECDLRNGFVCVNADQSDEMCLDYEVRFWCECGTGPYPSTSFTKATETPITTEIVTEQPVGNPSTEASTLSMTSEKPTCVPGWTEWINEDSPNVDNSYEYKGSGDYELVRISRESDKVCAKPKAIECRQQNTSIPWHLSEDDALECDLKNGFVCLNDEQSDLLCHDYEVRFWCECEGSPVTTSKPTTTITTPKKTTAAMEQTTPPEVAPSTLPPACVSHGWTEWMNVDRPDQYHNYEYAGSGDYELLTVLRRFVVYCEEPEAIQCRVTDSNVTWHQSDDDGLSCDLKNGFVCLNDQQHSGRCHDYQVRLWCDCPGAIEHSTIAQTTLPEITTELETTRSPTNPAQPSSTMQPGCVDGWTDWYNMDKPYDNSRAASRRDRPGDYELVSRIRYYQTLCMVPDDIECRLAASKESWINSEDDNLSCALPTGFACVNDDQFTEMCRDYEIRVHCTCQKETTTTVQAETTESSTKPATTTRETPSVTTNEVATVETTQEQTMSTFPAECSQHGWTEWMNSYRPDNLGDFESIPNLRTKYKFCAKPDSISCRSVNSGKLFESNGEFGVTCNTNGGLSCVNALQEDNECDDYEVRLYCVCASSPLVTTEAAAGSVGITEELTTQAITEKLTTSLCPPGQEWKPCAFKCNETCDAFRHKFIDLDMCSSNGDDNRCIPGCRSVVCLPPYVYKDPHTCVKPSQCPCIDSNGVYRKPLEKWTEEDCKSCICADNREMCAIDSRCTETTASPIKTTRATSSAEQTTQLPGQTVEPPGEIRGTTEKEAVTTERPIEITEATTATTRSKPTATTTLSTTTLTPALTTESEMTSSTLGVTTVANIDFCPNVTSVGLCPSSGCPKGQVCNSIKCVYEDECPCFTDGKRIEPGQYFTRGECEICICFDGKVLCEDPECACPEGGESVEPSRDNNCTCNCITTRAPELTSEGSVSTTTTVATPTTVGQTTTEDVCASVTCPVLTTPALRPGEYVDEGSTEDGCCKTVTVKCLPARCPAVGETECEAPKVARPRRLSQCCFDIECVCPDECPPYEEPECPENAKVEVNIDSCGCKTCGACVPCANISCPPLTVPPRLSLGEEIMKVRTDDGCCYENVVVCKPETCPKSRDIRCGSPGIVRNVDHGRCCSASECMCPEECPHVEKPNCMPGETFKVKRDWCGCTQYGQCISASKCNSCTSVRMFNDLSKTIGYFRHEHPVNGLCTNPDVVIDLRECTGSCESSSVYSGILSGFQKQCQCCKPLVSQKRKVMLYCENGALIQQTYENPTKCACKICDSGR